MTYILESNQPFSQSIIWQLQRAYFLERGMHAWRWNEVPSFITNNQVIAYNYVELILGYWHDHHATLTPEQPLMIFELGAGSGRLAFNILQQLQKRCEELSIAPTKFRYILSDITPKTLAWWREHPQFQPFFAAGMLDIAHFDLVNDSTATLEKTSFTLNQGSLVNPIIILANYVFDSIPYELFYLEQGQIYQCLTTVSTPTDPKLLTPAQTIAQLNLSYSFQPYQQPDLKLYDILETYRNQFQHSYIGLPTMGWAGLQRINRWSNQGSLLIAADKGDSIMEILENPEPPLINRHGSFSMYVNFHALATWYQNQGGCVMLPPQLPQTIHIGCFWSGQAKQQLTTTEKAYQQYIAIKGPDHYFQIYQFIQQQSQLTPAQLLEHLALSGYDEHVYIQLLPYLQLSLPQFTPRQRQQLNQALQQIWQNSFQLDTPYDLAYELGNLFYQLDNYQSAQQCFEHSLERYGFYTGVLYNLAACHYMLHEHRAARTILNQLLQTDPNDISAQQLLAALEPH